MDTEKSCDTYIDVDDALKRIGGNMDLYKRLLKRFVEGNHYEALVSDLQGGKMEDATRQAHTLKGVSANLSFNVLRAISADVERMLIEGSDYSQRLVELKNAYDATLEQISQLLS